MNHVKAANVTTRNFNDNDSSQLDQVEFIIKRLEAQHKEDVCSPGTPSRSLTPPPSGVSDFWREMSPQLSYIDGSSVSSVCPSQGRSISWNMSDLDGCLRAPHSLDLLDWRPSDADSASQGNELSPLPSLMPLVRHASDSLFTARANRNIGKADNPDAYELHCGVLDPFSRLLRPSNLSNSSDAAVASANSNVPLGIPCWPSRQLAVVTVQKNDVKSKIQKRLSFGDTLDLQTTIYTPAEDAEALANRGYFDGSALTKGSSNNSLERGRDEEPSYPGPPLVRRKSLDTQSQLSYYMDKDLRYYFQHPWLRLIVAYLVIFCNFLLFAEDPVSHSHTESSIPIVGNVFSFVATKYPQEWYWKMIKVIMWLIAIMCGMLVGKVLIHGILFKKMLRLKMFRDDQGSWMTMCLTVIVSLYMFSSVYNLVLLIGHYDYYVLQINRDMGVTNEKMMKGAATLTWLGDLVTALMVTDMMLQDNLYPHWASSFRRLYRLSNIPRILIFWCGSIVVATIVIFLIVSDYISWDKLNKGFVETTELSRAFLASFILVMDLLIVMQDWDFPHFTMTIDVNLPGFYTHTLHWRYAETKVTGKWFNYGIIFIVMLFDFNMWKNQIFYAPQQYGQYIDPVSRKVFSVEDENVLKIENGSLWTWEGRGEVDALTGQPYRDNDMFMYSRYMGYDLSVKCTAFIPIIIGFVMFFALISLYGRFPPNQDGTYGGRLKKRTKRSSWRRERRATTADQHCRESHSSDNGNADMKMMNNHNNDSSADL